MSEPKQKCGECKGLGGFVEDEPTASTAVIPAGTAWYYCSACNGSGSLPVTLTAESQKVWEAGERPHRDPAEVFENGFQDGVAWMSRRDGHRYPPDADLQRKAAAEMFRNYPDARSPSP